MNPLLARLIVLFTLSCATSATCWGADASAMSTALDSINATDLRNHVNALADDTFEGREAGSRGGRAAGLYIVRHLEKFGLPGGVAGKYYQPFSSYSNIIALLEGSDPTLKQQYIVVGAHYDHVGYGSRRNSYGPFGYIHNGADDNASGVSGLLEVAEAFTRLNEHPRRSILFCFWDGEEKGLYGSKHWVEHPTVPLNQVVLAFNADMIGRLRKERLEVLGTRTAPGFRRLVSLTNDNPALTLFFNWELKENSDHHSFFTKQIPILMFHTGLHDDYHRPSDDVEKINVDGMQQTSRLLFQMLDRAADEPQLGKFRPQARSEGPSTQQMLDRPLAPLPGRLGMTWDEKQAAEGRIVAVRIVAGSPADKAGLRIGDRISEFAGTKLESSGQFRTAVLSAKNPVEVAIERSGQTEPIKANLELTGTPVRLGISWRVDDAEPGTLIVNRVVPGSPADKAGIKLNDRIYQAGGEDSLSSESFQAMVANATAPLELLVESAGQPRHVSLELSQRP